MPKSPLLAGPKNISKGVSVINDPHIRTTTYTELDVSYIVKMLQWRVDRPVSWQSNMNGVTNTTIIQHYVIYDIP